jgi:hypothetical protein
MPMIITIYLQHIGGGSKLNGSTRKVPFPLFKKWLPKGKKKLEGTFTV